MCAESYSLANHINMSSRAAMCLKQQCSGVALTSRGMMKVKGKGDMEVRSLAATSAVGPDLRADECWAYELPY